MQYTTNDGISRNTVSVTASNAGTLVASGYTLGCTVTLPATAAVAVWFCFINESEVAATAVTAVRGIRITPGNGYFFSAQEHGWKGKIAGILESGSTAVSVEVMTW